jgi:thiamine-phosphate pyrophosphorylase
MAHVAHWIGEGVELVQIRERGLGPRDLAEVVRQILRVPNPHATKILVNDRADVALACGAHGVHLRDDSVEPAGFKRPGFLVTMACHRVEDAERTSGADYVLLAPIFEPLSKTGNAEPLGTGAITEFTRRSRTPVLALGGVTHDNARACLDAGAVGIAGITCFER